LLCLLVVTAVERRDSMSLDAREDCETNAQRTNRARTHVAAATTTDCLMAVQVAAEYAPFLNFTAAMELLLPPPPLAGRASWRRRAQKSRSTSHPFF
jgi:hypothetical protein